MGERQAWLFTNFSAVVFYDGCGYVYRSSWGEEESTEALSKETGELVFRRARYC